MQVMGPGPEEDSGPGGSYQVAPGGFCTSFIDSVKPWEKGLGHQGRVFLAGSPREPFMGWAHLAQDPEVTQPLGPIQATCTQEQRIPARP